MSSNNPTSPSYHPVRTGSPGLASPGSPNDPYARLSPSHLSPNDARSPDYGAENTQFIDNRSSFPGPAPSIVGSNRDSYRDSIQLQQRDSYHSNLGFAGAGAQVSSKGY